MPTIIELITPTDTIAFHATPDITGYVYDNEALDKWYELPPTDPKLKKRPNAHGAYRLGKVYTNEARPVIPGQYYGSSAADALAARNRLNALYSDGDEITMRVTDEQGVTTRTVNVLEVAPRFHHDFSHVPFDIALVAVDPRRYGPTVPFGTAMPAAGSGLVWDLGTAGSGLFFDWGTPGTTGLVEFTNTGNATTYPRIEVGGDGAFVSGFRVTEVETGRELIYSRSTTTGQVIVLDSRTGRAYLGDGDVTGSLSSRDWFEIPKGSTRRYQINPLASVSGTPTMTLYAAPAYM